jgi:hypothetical protein
MYGFLADLIVGVHVAYVGYVVVGLLLIVIGWVLGWKWVRNFWFRISHLLMMLAVVYEEIMNIRCPLSVWEENCRALAGQPVTGETFMGRILHAVLFYDAPSWVFTLGYFSVGALIVATFLFCRPRWPFGRKKGEAMVPAA